MLVDSTYFCKLDIVKIYASFMNCSLFDSGFCAFSSILFFCWIRSFSSMQFNPFSLMNLLHEI